jgi:hypothetical protein
MILHSGATEFAGCSFFIPIYRFNSKTNILIISLPPKIKEEGISTSTVLFDDINDFSNLPDHPQ